MDMQVQQAVTKAHVILAFIVKEFEYRSREVLLQLYRALVRPNPEYCAQFWSLYLRKDVLAAEGVQHRFTRLNPRMSIAQAVSASPQCKMGSGQPEVVTEGLRPQSDGEASSPACQRGLVPSVSERRRPQSDREASSPERQRGLVPSVLERLSPQRVGGPGPQRVREASFPERQRGFIPSV
eukprot:g29491.t1